MIQSQGVFKAFNLAFQGLHGLQKMRRSDGLPSKVGFFILRQTSSLVSRMNNVKHHLLQIREKHSVLVPNMFIPYPVSAMDATSGLGAQPLNRLDQVLINYLQSCLHLSCLQQSVGVSNFSPFGGSRSPRTLLGPSGFAPRNRR